jgi:hypothetical protein
MYHYIFIFITIIISILEMNEILKKKADESVIFDVNILMTKVKDIDDILKAEEVSILINMFYICLYIYIDVYIYIRIYIYIYI